MNTIGQRISETPEERSKRRWAEAKRERRKAAIFGALLVIGAGALLVIGALFAVVYLVTLAVRLAWGP